MAKKVTHYLNSLLQEEELKLIQVKVPVSLIDEILRLAPQDAVMTKIVRACLEQFRDELREKKT